MSQRERLYEWRSELQAASRRAIDVTDFDGAPEDLDADIGFVTVRNIPERCVVCGSPVDEARFRCVRDESPVNAALERAGGGEDTVFDGLPWVCSLCAVREERCAECGAPAAGMRHRWIIDDDGLVTCNPYAVEWPRTPGSCTNPRCGRYSLEDTLLLARLRVHVVRHQGFPDPYG